MKRILLIIAALTAGMTLSAQNKGEMSLTGTLLLSGSNTVVATNSGEQTTTLKTTGPASLDVGVGFGYFVANNFEMGIGLYYGLDRQRNSHSTSENFFYDATSSFTIKPELAYYVPLVLGKFFWVPSLELGLGFNTTKSQLDKETTTSVKNPFLFTLGLDILSFELRPWKHIGFDFSLGGLYYRTTRGETSTEISSVKTITHDLSFGFRNSFSPTLGVKYIF